MLGLLFLGPLFPAAYSSKSGLRRQGDFLERFQPDLRTRPLSVLRVGNRHLEMICDSRHDKLLFLTNHGVKQYAG